MSVVMRGRNTGTHTVELVHESGSVIHTMAPKDNGGDGSNFSPTDLCAVSLGACCVTIMSMYAANHGIQVLLDPIETGGYLTTLLDNGTTRCQAYGHYLGSRYRAFDNILWMSGNDFQSWSTTANDAVAVSTPTRAWPN